MSIKALSLSATWDFQDPADPDFGTPEATTFVLQCLDSRVMAKMKDGAATVRVDPSKPDDIAETSINMEEMNFNTAQFAIQGWENLHDPDKAGVMLEHSTIGRRLGGVSYRIVDPEVLKRVPLSTIRKIAQDVRARNELSEDDEKN